MTAPLEGEHRTGPRVARPVMVRYRCPEQGEQQWLVSPLRDLSDKGARFLSERSFDAGAMLDLRLMLPTAKQPVALAARVAWVKPGRLGLTELGVTFDPADAETQVQLELAVAHFLKKQPPGR